MSLRIIISPAKKMNADPDSLAWRDLPAFLPQTEQLLARLRAMSAAELKKLWKCNDQIAALNLERLQTMELDTRLTPAVLAYEGIQYRYMAPNVFTEAEFSYVQEHLRVLSGFYGVLRPFDGVTPYRLEMQAKLAMGEHKDLYAFWGDRLAQHLCAETDCIIDLASKEYSQCISRHLPTHVRMISCVFGEALNGKIVEKGTMCKMARVEMVRYMATHQVNDPAALCDFTGLQFRFSSEHSDEKTLVFLRTVDKTAK